MLQLPTPTQPQSGAQLGRERVKTKSPLSLISADIQPIEPEGQNDLLDVLCHMKDEDDVSGMMDLYDFFVKISGAARNVFNYPRTAGRASAFIETEDSQMWAKAYLVADFLKDMRPGKYDIDRYSEILFSCTLQMGNRLKDAAAVVNEIASWDLKQPMPRSGVR